MDIIKRMNSGRKLLKPDLSGFLFKFTNYRVKCHSACPPQAGRNLFTSIHSITSLMSFSMNLFTSVRITNKIPPE